MILFSRRISPRWLAKGRGSFSEAAAPLGFFQRFSLSTIVDVLNDSRSGLSEISDKFTIMKGDIHKHVYG